MYATMATKMSVSYRKNSDYTKQFDWAYDLIVIYATVIQRLRKILLSDI